MDAHGPIAPADPHLLQALEALFATSQFPGVQSARLFGSHAAGRPHRESDVDVAVLVDRKEYPERIHRSRLRVDLTSAAMGALRRNEVDLVILNDLPPLFARRILDEGHRFFVVDLRADQAFALQTRLRAADLEPWLRRMARLKLEALKR